MMDFTRIQRRFTAWLAMLAVALGALAPGVAQALVTPSDRSDWVQICNASGMVWIQADALAVDTERAPMADMGALCGWCLLHSPAAGLPPAPMMAVASRLPQPLPVGFSAVPPPVGVWTAAPARAPPAQS